MVITVPDLEKYLVTKVPLVREHMTVKQVLLMLNKDSNTYDSVDYIYVLNKTGIVLGYLPIQDIINSPKSTAVKKIMHKNVVTVSLHTELEKVSHMALEHNLKQVVVTKSKKFLGVIVSRKILHTINKSLREDIFHFAGIHKSHLEFENSLEMPIYKVLRHRLSWLIAGLFGAIFMALYISLFEETLATYLLVASFIPAIVYISGALGTQIQTIFVRDLAVLGNKLNLKKYFFKQLYISLLISLIIGFLLFSFIALFWKSPLIALAIGLASFISLICTGAIAFFITLAIKRFNFDPALGSGPIATIISDITSVVIYFIVVVLLL